MSTYKVGYFVGSLATASINRLLSKALIRLAPPELQFTEIPFKDLPLYSYDYDADFPPVARAYKQAIADVDGAIAIPACCSSSPSARPTPGIISNVGDCLLRPGTFSMLAT